MPVLLWGCFQHNIHEGTTLISAYNLLLFAPAQPTGEPVDGSIGGLLFYITVALGFSFLCSMWEAGLLSSSSSYVETLANEGSAAGQTMKDLKENVDRPISAILTLNTVAHTVGAAGAGAQAAAVFGNQWFGLISAVLTLLILVFSEIIPKTLGAVYWRQLLAFNAYSIRILVFLFTPIVWTFQKLTNAIAHDDGNNVVTRSELETMAELSSTSGSIAESEHNILKNLLRLDDVQVNTIMTPRPILLAIQESTTVGEVMRMTSKIPYSRIPIYADNADDITAFVLRYDILTAAAKDEHHRPISNFRREMVSVPETMSVSKVMTELLNRKQHIALVFDEYGGTAGIITMEDAVESLLGAEITDESDIVEDLRILAQQRFERQKAVLGLVTEEYDQIKAVGEEAGVSARAREADIDSSDVQIETETDNTSQP
jgi:CBS domain containing-hemolysin-like protein